MSKKEFKKFWVIARKGYKNNVKSMGFILTLIAPIVMVIVPFAIGHFTSSSTETSSDFAVISEDETIRSLFDDEDLPWTLVNDIQSESEAREAVIDESLDGYMLVRVEEDVSAELVQVDGNMEQDLPIIEELLSSYQTSIRSAQADLTTQEMNQILEPASLSTESIRVESGEIIEGNVSDQSIQTLFIVLIVFALFLLLMMYSNNIVQEIASEKGTRIMEIILSTTSSHVHFLGKLAGILMMLGTQFLVYIALFAFGLPFLENSSLIEEIFGDIQITTVIQPTYWYVITFFVIGLLIYIIFSAFLGSLTNKVEDAAKMMAPIQTVSVIGFYSSIFMITGADNRVIDAFSYIPFFTPFIMPVRIVQGNVGALGITISIISSLIFVLALLLLSLYFYRTNVLVYSDSNIFISIKKSWSLIQSDRTSKKARAVDNETA